ncbi:unnamed protein product [Pipistrellus nathusii]|uniref:Lipocalin/cytosolic fatty-acid binding domain-containing protein n=1 Tax=Pipistrellus nathusii TaxID=59473 RepID=A0ABN9Z4X0_PIPNA
MRCLLLAVSVALVCGTQDVAVPRPMESLDAPKVAGTWYTVAMAASNPALLSAPLRLYVQELKPTAQGDLEIMVRGRQGARWCVEKKILAERTESAGEFNINYPVVDRLVVLDTDYENFLFACLESSAAPEQIRACQYLARTPKVDRVAMEQFEQALKLLSVHIHIILTPKQAQERCRV